MIELLAVDTNADWPIYVFYVSSRHRKKIIDNTTSWSKNLYWAGWYQSQW